MNIIDVKHEGLGKFRRIAGPERNAVERRAGVQKKLWDEQWTRRRDLERRYFAGPNADALQALKKAQAEDMSEDAGREIVALASILLNALHTKPVADWSLLADRREFAELPPPAPSPLQLAKEPRKSDFMPPPPRSLSDLLHTRRRRRQREAALSSFKSAHDEWAYTVQWKSQEHDRAVKGYQAALSGWDVRRSAFYGTQGDTNARLEALRQRYNERNTDAVAAHADLVLLSVERGESFPKYWKIGVSPSGALTVDYDLPSTDQMPGVKAVKYVPSRDTFETLVMDEREGDQLYSEAVHQTCLAVLHLLFVSDAADAIRAIAFNGWVNFLDKTNGRPGRACIMSVQTTKHAFSQIDLSSVDPKACFRALNGTASAKLAAMGARTA